MRSRARTEGVPRIQVQLAAPSIRTGLGADAILEALVHHLRYEQGKLPQHANRHDWYMALAYTVRDRLLDRCHTTTEQIGQTQTKIVAYLSTEFLPGPHLGNSLICLGILPATERALAAVGQSLEGILEQEEEPGLGTSGVGRAAACHLDSLATLEVPAIGYGIRYEFGVFDQAIHDGWQVELTDKWLRFGNPWEIVRADVAYDVGFGGNTERYVDERGVHVRWHPRQMVKGVAYDTPVPGYRVPTANLLRLWKAEAIESFDFEAYKRGDYYRAVAQKVASETISKVLYPSDEPSVGARMRLAQQYFFVSCSLQDMVRRHRLRGQDLSTFAASWVAQLNDTPAAIAIAELMRLLVDEHGLTWDAAWAMTQQTCAYTHHPVLTSRLENWPVALLGSLLPRHLEIIYEINRRFLDDVRARCPGDRDVAERLSLIDETNDGSVRMAHVASVGSHAINDAGAPQTMALKDTVLSDMYRTTPEKFFNVSNGVTPRRWLVLCNPGLAALVSRGIGEGWMVDLDALERLEPLAADAGFQRNWRAVKSANKRALAAFILTRTGIAVDPQSMFDIHVQRVNEQARQLLNIVRVVALYNRIKQAGEIPAIPRTIVFGGKAAPGHRMAKLIIKLINSVADVVNGDPAVAPAMRVVFVPDFNVKTAQRIYPAADVAEQISVAGDEAGETGSVKFALNGAPIIGTLHGRNVELRDAVGGENFFRLGESAHDLREHWHGGYAPREVYAADPELRAAIDAIRSGVFSNGDRGLFTPIVECLLARDEHRILADYRPYMQTQQAVDTAYGDERRWTRMSILNTARVGRFSSDRSIREYCRDIWKLTATPADA